MRKLQLKFIVDLGTMKRLVISYAKMIPPFNLYKDAEFIYTEEGKFHRSNVLEPVDEEWIIVENIAETMPDLQL